MFRLFVIVACFGFIAADYCDPSLCPNGAKHIACGHTGGFAASCPSDKRIERLSGEQISLILDMHNKLRNDVAGGNLNGFRPASRMATLVSLS
jgi:hypothetical protein